MQVHANPKARPHRCLMCGNHFARVDTLQKHVEDGCPERQKVKLDKALNDAINCQPSSVRLPVATPSYSAKSPQSSEPSESVVPAKVANCRSDEDCTHQCWLYVSNRPCDKKFQQRIDLVEHINNVSLSDLESMCFFILGSFHGYCSYSPHTNHLVKVHLQARSAICHDRASFYNYTDRLANTPHAECKTDLLEAGSRLKVPSALISFQKIIKEMLI